MKNRKYFLVTGAYMLNAILSGTVLAGPEMCNALLTNGLNNISKSCSHEEASSRAIATLCSESYESSSSNKRVSMQASASYLGFGGSLGRSISDAQMRVAQEKYCSSGFNEESYLKKSCDETQFINDNSLNAWTSCIDLNSRGLDFKMSSTPSLSGITISLLWKGSRQSLLQGIAQPDIGTAICKASVKQNNKWVSIEIGEATKLPLTTKYTNIVCKRNPEVGSDGEVAYSPLRLTVKTDEGAFDVDLASVGYLPLTSVDKIKAEILPNTVKQGAILPFDTETCPEGWERYVEASGRSIIGTGLGDGLTNRQLLEQGGEENHTLTISEMPAHRHRMAMNETRFTGQAQNNFLGGSSTVEYGLGEDGNGHSHGEYPNIVGTTGGGIPHNNMPPFIALTYCKKL